MVQQVQSSPSWLPHPVPHGAGFLQHHVRSKSSQLPAKEELEWSKASGRLRNLQYTKKDIGQHKVPIPLVFCRHMSQHFSVWLKRSSSPSVCRLNTVVLSCSIASGFRIPTAWRWVCGIARRSRSMTKRSATWVAIESLSKSQCCAS